MTLLDVPPGRLRGKHLECVGPVDRAAAAEEEFASSLFNLRSRLPVVVDQDVASGASHKRHLALWTSPFFGHHVTAERDALLLKEGTRGRELLRCRKCSAASREGDNHELWIVVTPRPGDLLQQVRQGLCERVEVSVGGRAVQRVVPIHTDLERVQLLEPRRKGLNVAIGQIVHDVAS